MTPLRTAVGRVPPEIVFVVGAVGFFVAVSALVTAAGGLALAWAASPASSGCSLFICVGEALNNALGIPGSVVGAVVAVVVLIVLPGSEFPLPGSGSSPGDDVTTYIPGVSPLPDKGDTIYLPSQGASKVINVYYDPDTFHPDGTPGGVIIETELGSVLVVGIDLDEQ